MIRRAVRYYVEQNPDDLQAFRDGSAQSRGVGQSGDRGVEETRVNAAEAVETGRESQPADTPGAGVYDPTEDAK